MVPTRRVLARVCMPRHRVCVPSSCCMFFCVGYFVIWSCFAICAKDWSSFLLVCQAHPEITAHLLHQLNLPGARIWISPAFRQKCFGVTDMTKRLNNPQHCRSCENASDVRVLALLWAARCRVLRHLSHSYVCLRHADDIRRGLLRECFFHAPSVGIFRNVFVFAKLTPFYGTLFPATCAMGPELSLQLGWMQRCWPPILMYKAWKIVPIWM